MAAQQHNINDINKRYFLHYLENLDAGKAIFAAFSALAIGYFANVIAKILACTYWIPYFEYFHIPFEYLDSTKIFSISTYPLLIAVSIGTIYFFAMNRYYSLLKKHRAFTTCKQPVSGVKKCIQAVFLIVLPFMFVHFFFIFISSCIDRFQGFIITSIFVSSYTLCTLITLAYGFYSFITSFRKNKAMDFFASPADNLFAIIVMATTTLVFSLLLVYVCGCFQIDSKVLLKLNVVGEKSDNQYALILDMEEAYFCSPIICQEIEGSRAGDYILFVQNDSYRIIPKDTSVIISDTNAVSVLVKHRYRGLHSLIADNDITLSFTAYCCVAVMMLLLYLESKCLRTKSMSD